MNSLRKFSGFAKSFPIGRDRRRRVSLVLLLPRRNFLSKPIRIRPKSENPKGLDRGIEERAVKEPLLWRWTGSFP
jgi:hypothetical protein